MAAASLVCMLEQKWRHACAMNASDMLALRKRVLGSATRFPLGSQRAVNVKDRQGDQAKWWDKKAQEVGAGYGPHLFHFFQGD